VNRPGGPADWNTPIWQHDLDKGLRIPRLAIGFVHECRTEVIYMANVDELSARGSLGRLPNAWS